MLFIQVHILVYEVEQIVSVRSCGVSQVDNGHLVAVFRGYRSVVSHNVALGVCREEGHSTRTGVFDTRVQPKCRFTDTCRTDHESMNVTCVDHCNGVFITAFATDDDALRKRFFYDLWLLPFEEISFLHHGHGRHVSAFCLLAPLGRSVRHVGVNLLDFGLGSPPRCAVLTVADRLAFDVV